MSWPVVKLGDLVKFIGGSQPPKSTFKYEPMEGYIRLLQIRDYKSNNNLTFIPESSTKKFCSKKDIMIGRYGPPVFQILRGLEGAYNVALMKAEPSKSVDRDYLFYFLKQDTLFRLIDGLSQRTAGQSGVDMDALKAYPMLLPPLDEQKRIAAILDKADTIRRKRQQAIQLADDFLRSVFLDMFGADLQRSTSVTTFGDVSILDAKMVDPREEEYLDLLHIGPDRIEKNTGKLLPALTAREEQLISKKFLFDNQYILYSKIRPYLRKVAVPDFKALCSADMYPIKPVKGKVTREFMWMLLLSDYFDNYVSSLPARANIPKLNRTELAAFKFSLPDYTKIEKFTAVVQKSHQGTKSIKSSYVESNNLFDALSQKAFAGEL
ncbi:restriction endonuclease subunit S [Pseudoalteromonas mariniglutinosa]